MLSNVATALCRCSYETRNHHCLVAEFNTAQALCYVMQRQDANLKITSAKGILNICGLSSTIPALSAKLDVWMLTICSALEDLARNEMEVVQVRRSYKYDGGIMGGLLTSVVCRRDDEDNRRVFISPFERGGLSFVFAGELELSFLDGSTD